jgi:hypothetical protein
LQKSNKRKAAASEAAASATDPLGIMERSDSKLPVLATEEKGILESYAKLPSAEREIVRRLIETFQPGRPAIIRIPVPKGPKQIKARREILLPVYRLLRYHRLIFDSIGDGALRSIYLPWTESITHVSTEQKEEVELQLNRNYEHVWSTLKQRLEETSGRLKSIYSSRLYWWAMQQRQVGIGYKRVSLATMRTILGLEDIKDNDGNVVHRAPLEAWANLKQRALDPAIHEINGATDIRLELKITGRGSYRKVTSLGFRITAAPGSS